MNHFPIEASRHFLSNIPGKLDLVGFHLEGAAASLKTSIAMEQTNLLEKGGDSHG